MQDTRAGWSGMRAGQKTDEHSALATFRAYVSKLDARDYLIDRVAPCPWSVGAASSLRLSSSAARTRRPLYTAEERRRRDATAWTKVQGILAPIQFAVFLVSLGLVLNYLWFGRGYEVATASVIVKTILLYAIMITGSIWEKIVFGRFLFARAFFWEDIVSMLVIGLHTAYLFEFITGSRSPNGLMLLVLAAYASYAVNATQFLLKLRMARLEMPGDPAAFVVADRAR